MRKRRGFTLTECVVAMAMLGTVLAGVAVALGRLETVNGEFAARSLALDLAGNALERATTLAARGQDIQSAAAPVMTPAASRQLPNLKVELSIKPLAADALVQITATVAWDGARGSGRRQVALVAWVRALKGVGS